jgi:8-oxo-dGTP pyrophosphatase MutT (NUDIX family)
MKSVVHAKGLRHRVSAILLKNDQGKYLIPTASETKVEKGGLFHSSAGHVKSGDSYEESAVRELKEETQLSVDIDSINLLGTFWVEKDYPTRSERERFEVFEIDYFPSMGKVVFNEEQTNEMWLSIDELKEIYSNDLQKLSYPLRLTCENIFHFKSH